MRHTLLFLFLPLPLLADSVKIFPADAIFDVTKPPYNAVPNDDQDDTAAIQRAISENVGFGRVLYFPEGTYDLSDTLVAKNTEGLWRARITLQGAGREKTLLKLADSAPGFGDPAAPKAVYMSGSQWSEGDSLDGGGNKAFSNNVFDLTIGVGNGNPGAIGIEWANSNQGTIGEVDIRSKEGGGASGIAMRRKIPGPGFIRDCKIVGFQTGIDLGDMQYGFTLEKVFFMSQSGAGLRISDNLIHARRLVILNDVPAVMVTGHAGAITLVDSILGRTPSINSAGSLYLQGIDLDGNEKAPLKARDGSHTLPDGKELAIPPALGSTASEKSNGEVPETPTFWNANLDDWQPVGDRHPGESDDTQAIQRALDSGKSTIYFRNTRVYFLSDTLIVRGRVRQILGMGAELNLGAAKEPFSDRANPRPLIRIDPVEGENLFIENILFNAQYPGEVVFENNSSKPLIIKHCLGWIGAEGQRRSYRNTPAATGPVFIEDVFMPGWEFRNQTVWARQFNPENYDGDGASPQVLNENGQLWILGFKTEGPAPFITTRGPKARTILLGAYNYISAAQATPLPATAIPYIIDHGAKGELTFVTENFREGSDDYATYIKDGDHAIPPSELPPRWNGVNPKSRAVSKWRSK